MKKWQKAEKKDQKDLCAKGIPRSGGTPMNPGDQKDSVFLYDSKQTDKKSYSITSKVWQKLYSEAILQKRLPALVIHLGTGEELVVLFKADFAWLKEEALKYKSLCD